MDYFYAFLVVFFALVAGSIIWHVAEKIDKSGK